MQDNQNQAHWAYAAGIMDSDGCFMIVKHKRRKDGYHYVPTVRITMITDKAINYVIQSTGIGKVYINGIRKSRPNSLPLYEWRIFRREQIEKFIKGILPYLHNKKERAELLLEFLDKGKYGCHVRGSHKELNDEILHYREEMHHKMRELNGNNAGATTESLGSERTCDSLTS